MAMSDSVGVTLDLTGRKPLSPENAKTLNELAIGLRPRIVEMIDQISIGRSNDIDWWVTPLASRNPFSSRLFLSCCRIALLDNLLATSKAPTEVWVDSHAMAGLASRLGSRYGVELRIRIAWGRYLYDTVLCPPRNLLTALFHAVMQFVCARLFLSRCVASGSSSYILVDTFLYADSIRDGIFHDRHFPDIAKFLTAAECMRLRYFPTFYKVRNYPKFFHRMRRLRESFFFKEDHLHLRDYLFAFGHGFRIGRVRPDETLMLNGLPLNAIIREEFRRGWMWPSAIEALLKNRAICRMSEADVKIGRVLDWFENQDIDRGANAGYRRYYPNTEVVGYIGYVASQHYLCMYPSPVEKKAKVLPTKFAVMGRGFCSIIKEFCPELVVEVAPALRYSDQLPFTASSTVNNDLSILVALPVMRPEALEILEVICHLLRRLENTPLTKIKIHVCIKPHPASDSLQNYEFGISQNSNIQISWVNEKLDSLLRRVDVLVSAASSACFEALTMGVPVIVFGSCYGLTYVPIPKVIPQKRWQVCYSHEEMLTAIMALQAKCVTVPEGEEEVARFLREEYLESVSRIGVRHLVLGVNSK